jgi:hypothetical protein
MGFASKMREEPRTDEIEARGVYLMEWPKAAPLVPPVSTLRREAINILWIYRAAESAHSPGSAPALRVRKARTRLSTMQRARRGGNLRRRLPTQALRRS